MRIIFLKKIDYKKLKDQLIKLKNDDLVNKFKSLNFKVLSFLSENDKIFQPSLEKFNSLVSKNILLNLFLRLIMLIHSINLN